MKENDRKSNENHKPPLSTGALRREGELTGSATEINLHGDFIAPKDDLIIPECPSREMVRTAGFKPVQTPLSLNESIVLGGKFHRCEAMKTKSRSALESPRWKPRKAPGLLRGDLIGITLSCDASAIAGRLLAWVIGERVIENKAHQISAPPLSSILAS